MKKLCSYVHKDQRGIGLTEVLIIVAIVVVLGLLALGAKHLAENNKIQGAMEDTTATGEGDGTSDAGDDGEDGEEQGDSDDGGSGSSIDTQ